MHRVEQGDGRLGTFEPEALLADVLGLEELLQRLGRVQPLEDAALLLRGDERRDPFDVFLDPALLVGFLDVHVLDADGPAVGVPEDAEDLAEGQAVPAGQAVGEELPVEVPDRQAVGRRVELGVGVGCFPVEGVEVGDQVASDPVHVDQGLDVDLLLEVGLIPIAWIVDVPHPPDGLVGHAHGVEDLVVEAVLPEQQAVDELEEHARFGALDDAVVVGRGEGDDLRDAELGQHPGVGGLPLRRILEAPDADDDPLAGHQPRHRLDGADGAGVGQGDGGAAEVVR